MHAERGEHGAREEEEDDEGPPPGLVLSPAHGPIRDTGGYMGYMLAGRGRGALQKQAMGHFPRAPRAHAHLRRGARPGGAPAASPPLRRSPRLARRALPIHTSPNCPLPSFLRSWRDSRGISHTSLVLTERSASLGVPLGHGTARRQHSPAARSAAPGRGRRHPGVPPALAPALLPLQSPPPQNTYMGCAPSHRGQPCTPPAPL